MRVVATTSIIMTPKMLLSYVSFELAPKVAIIRLLMMNIPETSNCTGALSILSSSHVAESVIAKKIEPRTRR